MVVAVSNNKPRVFRMKQVIFVTILSVYISAILALATTHPSCKRLTSAQCQYQIVQSMPEKLDLKDPPGVTTVPTHKSLIDMADGARETLNIVSFYWVLNAPKQFDGHPSVEPGRHLMEAIDRASKRGVKVEIVLDHSGSKDMNNPDDIEALKRMGQVNFLDMKRLLHSGIVHSKFMIADNKTFYVGSSNFDWRSYTQIKEIGLSFSDCPKLAQDLDKIFRTYKLMSQQEKLPQHLGDDLKTEINLVNPLELDDFKLFLGAAPVAFNGGQNGTEPTGRTDDIAGLLHVIERARRRIDISVMNYSPRFEFSRPHKYWPRIDDALRRAAIERGVQVRLLFSNWTDTKPTEPAWYRSLNAIQSKGLRSGGIHAKLFRVPAFDEFEKSIPYARVKHDKYMVTERDLYVGTSNWTPDYFTVTCGVGIVIQPGSGSPSCDDGSGGDGVGGPPQVVQAMQAIFERDFNSNYAHELDQDF